MNEVIKKNGITYGIILGVFSILVTTIIYAIDIKMFMSWWVGLLSIAINIIIGCVLVSKTKKALNNQISFKETFTVYFIAAAIAGVLSTLFMFLLFNVIDPGMKATLQEMTIQYMVETLQKFGTPAATINETVTELQKTDNYSPKNLFMGLLFTLVINAIFGLILALIFKSKTSHSE